ncbi:MAG: hypothetical protein Q9160_004241 [Pyrenula sp. 1 TL-2023]
METQGSSESRGISQHSQLAQVSSFVRDEREADAKTQPDREGDIGSSQQDLSALPNRSATASDKIQWSTQAPFKSREISAETRARWELLKALAGVDHHGPSAEAPSSQAIPCPPEPYNSLRRNRSRRKRQAVSRQKSSGGSMRPLMLPQMVRNDAQGSRVLAGQDATSVQQTPGTQRSPPGQQHAAAHQAARSQLIPHGRQSSQRQLPSQEHQRPQDAQPLNRQSMPTSSPQLQQQQHKQHQGTSQQGPPQNRPLNSAPSHVPPQSLLQNSDITLGIAPDYNLTPNDSQYHHLGNAPLRNHSRHIDSSQPDLNQPLQNLANTLFSGFPTMQSSPGTPSLLSASTQATPIQAPNTERPVAALQDPDTNQPSNSFQRLRLPSLIPILATSRSPVPSSVASPVSVSSVASSDATARPQSNSPPSPTELKPRLPTQLVPSNPSTPPPSPIIPPDSHPSPPAHPPPSTSPKPHHPPISATNTNRQVPSTAPTPKPASPHHPSQSSCIPTSAPIEPLDYSYLLSLPPEEVLFLLASGEVPREFLSSREGEGWVMQGQLPQAPQLPQLPQFPPKFSLFSLSNPIFFSLPSFRISSNPLPHFSQYSPPLPTFPLPTTSAPNVWADFICSISVRLTGHGEGVGARELAREGGGCRGDFGLIYHNKMGGRARGAGLETEESRGSSGKVADVKRWADGMGEMGEGIGGRRAEGGGQFLGYAED